MGRVMDRGNGKARRGVAARLLAATAVALLLGGCRVAIQVPPGGQVISDNGVVCNAGQVCTLDIRDTNFLDTFRAVAATGYSFTGWRSASGYICGGSSKPCTLNTAGFAGNTTLEAILAGSSVFYLAPEFAAEDAGRYDRQAWAALLAGLGSSQYRSNQFLFQVAPNTANCDPGVLTSAARNRMLDTVNLIRRLHYLPPVSYETFHDTQMQQAALVQRANGYLSHYPQPGDACYSAGAAAGAGSANLSYSSSQGDPAYYVLGWANDNYNIASMMEAGHRRWLLHPSLGYTSYGQVAGVAAMKVFGFAQLPSVTLPEDLEYVAFPYRNYPHILVSGGGAATPWSLSMVPAPGVSSLFDHFSSATVTVTADASGEQLAVHSVHRDTKGYGLANFLSWMVDGWMHDTAYTVTIDNVRMRDGSFRQIQYPVRIEYAALQP